MTREKCFELVNTFVFLPCKYKFVIMKKGLIIIGMIGLLWECSTDPGYMNLNESRECIGVESRSGISPPRNYLDSFEMAIEDIKALFFFQTDYTFIYLKNLSFQPVPVMLRVIKTTKEGIFYFNEDKIREYDMNGLLLIALHEWYHLLRGCGKDERDHPQMMVDPEYLMWIQVLFNVDEAIAKYFLYIGFEDTDMYESLSGLEKDLVDWVKRNYHIKKR